MRIGLKPVYVFESLHANVILTVYFEIFCNKYFFVNLPTAFKYSPKLSEEIISNLPVRAILVAELI